MILQKYPPILEVIDAAMQGQYKISFNISDHGENNFRIG